MFIFLACCWLHHLVLRAQIFKRYLVAAVGHTRSWAVSGCNKSLTSSLGQLNICSCPSGLDKDYKKKRKYLRRYDNVGPGANKDCSLWILLTKINLKCCHMVTWSIQEVLYIYISYRKKNSERLFVYCADSHFRV